MAILPIQLRPTFPLDEKRIEKIKRDLIWRSPRLIFGQFAARIAKSFRSAGVTHPTSLVMRCLDWWTEVDQELTSQVISYIVAESNSTQDRSIQSLVMRLKNDGHTQYSISLGRFLMLKQRIEGSLHHDGQLSERKEEIEILVDSICQEVCNEFARIAATDESLANVLTSRDPNQLDEVSDELRASHTRIMHAYSTLYDTVSQLAIDVTPLPDQRRNFDNATLDRLIENLREENEVAKSIDERIRSELPEIERR